MNRGLKGFFILGFCLVLTCFLKTRAWSDDLCLPEFSSCYSPVEVSSVTPGIPEYDLPLDPNKIVNYDEVFLLTEQWYSLLYCNDYSEPSITISPAGDTKKMLLGQGFAVAHIDRPYLFTMVSFYKQLRDQQIPILITSDSLLHLYHVQFDETLLELEGRQFYGDLLAMSQAMLSESRAGYEKYTGDLKEAARRNEAFFTIALKLLNPTDTSTVSSYVEEEVKAVLSRIQAHSGLANDPVFKYKEDYSQYVPRSNGQ